MVDPLAGGKLAAHILLDEIHQRDDDLDQQHRYDQHRDNAVHFAPAQGQEQQRVEHVAHAVQL